MFQETNASSTKQKRKKKTRQKKQQRRKETTNIERPCTRKMYRENKKKLFINRIIYRRLHCYFVNFYVNIYIVHWPFIFVFFNAFIRRIFFVYAYDIFVVSMLQNDSPSPATKCQTFPWTWSYFFSGLGKMRVCAGLRGIAIAYTHICG